MDKSKAATENMDNRNSIPGKTEIRVLLKSNYWLGPFSQTLNLTDHPP